MKLNAKKDKKLSRNRLVRSVDTIKGKIFSQSKLEEHKMK
jgi:hypothetical protein